MKLNQYNLNQFHNAFIALLRWDLNDEEFEHYYQCVQLDLEFYHSEFLSSPGLEIEDVFGELIGKRLMNDPNYVLRICRNQNSPLIMGRHQSISTNGKISKIYPILLKSIIMKWFNPTQDEFVIDVRHILENLEKYVPKEAE